MAKETNSRFLRLPSKLLPLCGMWDVEFESGLRRILYKLYFWFCFVSCYVLSLIHIVGMFIFIFDKKWDLIFLQVGISLSFYNCCFKITILKKEICKIFNQRFWEFEQIISSDFKSNIIYNDYLSFVEKIIKIYVIGVGFALMFVICTPTFQRVPTITINGTIMAGGNRYMLSVWYPITYEDHMIIAWTSEAWFLITVYMIFVFSDSFCFSLLVCCKSQLKVLQHKLENITWYSCELAKKEMIPLSHAEYLIVEHCILLHRQIIETMVELKRILKTYLLFEYMVCSLKLSLAMVNILWRDPPLATTVVQCAYVLSMSVEFYLYYWNANEVLLESSDGIYEAIAMSDWYDLDIAVQKRLLFILLRSKEPLTLSIGPFDIMSVDALIRVLKACYYYLSLAGQFTNKD